jgi:ATP-dependent Clp protease protease subunit
MIHQPSGGAQGVATDMEINLREMLKLKDELYKLSLSTQDKLLIKSMSVIDWMIAEEAKEYGMIDEVLKEVK